MLFTRSVVASAILFGAVTSANAQDATSNRDWVSWGANVAHEAVSGVMYPFEYGWSLVTGTTDEISAKKNEFIQQLKTSRHNFEQNVARTGYRISGIAVSPDIIPKVSLTLDVVKPLGKPEEALLRSEFESAADLGTVERNLLLALLDADEAAEKVRLAGYRFAQVEVGIVAIFPDLVFHFVPESTAAAQVPSTN